MSDSTCLGFDFGTRQIGVACGQTITNRASPLTILRANNGAPDWDEISRLIKEWKPDILIVGLPLNMDGSESEFCAQARRFARRLEGRYNLKTVMVDERLSTFEAKHANRNESKNPSELVDAEAAALILNTWLADPSQWQAPSG